MTFKTKSSLPLLILVLMFGNLFAARPAAAAAGQATFLRTDTTTQGNWKGVYGGDGYVFAATAPSSPPSYAVFTPQNQANWAWTSNVTDVRDLQIPGSTAANARQASCWYTITNNMYSLDVNITDGNTHQIALYLLDWDSRGRSEAIWAEDATSGALLDNRTVSNFTNGVYYIWNVSGHVTFNVTLEAGVNAVVSGAFFDDATVNTTSGIAHFVATDTTTQGSWRGVYGADGYNVVGDTQSAAAYAVLTPQGQQSWTWAGTTTDIRALQTGNGASRIAATWYNTPTFSIDVNVTDGNTHQIALYALDWDNEGRAETISVVDAQTKTVLDTRSIFGFANGIYAVWNVSGHVTFNITNSSGKNGVIGGVFFGGGSASSTPPATPPPPPVTPPTPPATPPVTSTTLPSGLVLHWTFDAANISGTTVTDSSNSGGTGTIYGSASPVVGELNQALSFNGINSYVTMNAYADTATEFNNSITLAAWIKTTNASRTEAVISKYTAAGSAAGYIFQTDSSGHLEFRVGAEDLNAYPATVVDTAKVNDGQWHHVAVVVTMGQGAQFYVDGVPTSTQAMNIFGGGDGMSNLEVAGCSYTPYAQYFTGSIDDVQVYNRALSGSEISTIYSASGQTPGTTNPGTTSQGTLSVSPASFSFGNVNVASSVTQTFTVSNTGAGNLQLTGVTVAGAGLTASGVSSGTMLAPGQSASLIVTYTPASAVALSGGGVTFTSNASDPSLLLSLTGTGVQPPPVSTNPNCPSAINAVSFNGIDTTTQGAWKGIGNFNAPPASSSLVYGKDGVILPDTEGCDTACNPFPSYALFGPSCVGASTPGNIGAKLYSTHAYVALVQAASAAMGPEPSNTTNTSFFQCNYTYSNPAAPWAPMVAWRPVVDTREISLWYTCSGINSYYLEFSFGNTTHNFEVYVVDDQNGGSQLRSEEIQVLDGDTNAVLYDSGSFTNFTGGVYYKWSVTGHVKVKVINTSTNGTNAVINGVFFN